LVKKTELSSIETEHSMAICVKLKPSALTTVYSRAMRTDMQLLQYSEFHHNATATNAQNWMWKQQ